MQKDSRIQLSSVMPLVVFTLLNGLDLLITYIGGIQNETNPVGRAVGFVGLAIGKALLIAYSIVLITLMRRLHRERWADFYQRIVIGIYVVVIAWNVRYLVLTSAHP